MNIDKKITSMYENIDYLGMYGNDVFYSVLLIAITIFIVSIQTYYSVMNELKTSWNLHRCNPIVMPFAGYIVPKPGQTKTETAFENFNYCVYQDISSVFSIIMMPFEFVLFLTIQFLQVTIESIKQTILLLAWIRDQLGEIFKKYYEQILNFIIPVIEMSMYMRDMLDKMNGVLITGFFTLVTVYNTSVSGIQNILAAALATIIMSIITYIAMKVAAAAMVATVLLAPLSTVVWAAAILILLSIIIPLIIMYIILRNDLKDIYNENAPSPPEKF